jgi:hypothetical protein
MSSEFNVLDGSLILKHPEPCLQASVRNQNSVNISSFIETQKTSGKHENHADKIQ